MGKLDKLFIHIKKGSIGSRILYQFSKQKKWEDFYNSSKEFILYRLGNNLKIKLYKNDYLSYLIFRGNFEKDEQQFLNSFLKPGATFLDIGANIGFFSLLASKKVQNHGKVFSFEPVPSTFKKLKENIEINKCKNITVFNNALSDNKETLAMQVSIDGFDAWNSFGKPSGGNKFSEIQFQTDTIDNLISTKLFSDKIDLIKIDVEGWELFVLKGAEKILLSDYGTVFMIEFNDENFKGAGYIGNDIFDFLESYGFSLYEFKPGKKLTKASRSDFFGYTNLFAAKNPIHF
ncbi:MAG: FkbM family methyltransferase [Bacteroidota bacterium]|nr:FkbM family methyltransferase [Bacteroidota bacterium]